MTDTLTIDVIDADGAKAGTTELPASVFAVPTNEIGRASCRERV